ncbi:DUF3046 domain-containing protein [Saxibacter everestensis]|uniref:DUF3046 domain-containing protein n=1 Tax=Saxibacter everestensis TaxID=2909229 RepID=A0ABY8QVX3_9MICO|nr:DUF3046 domain-containing protein [Brevibacteriaceae bacterium ZFBP1038]
MRHTAFWELMNDEFGSWRAQALFHDLALSTMSSRTAEEALGAGEDPRQVWLAVCEAADVPAERHLGISKPPSK